MTGIDRNIDRNRHAQAPQLGKISLSVRVLEPLLRYITARGHDSSVFLRAQGIDPTILSNPEARLPHTVAASLWLAAARLTNDLDLGLHVAEEIRPGAYGALGYALRTSENFGTSLQRLCRYHRVLHDAAEVQLTVRGDQVVLSHWLPVPGGLPRAVSEPSRSTGDGPGWRADLGETV